MVLPPSFSRKMGEIETIKAEKMGWLDLPHGTSCPTFPYGVVCLLTRNVSPMKRREDPLVA